MSEKDPNAKSVVAEPFDMSDMTSILTTVDDVYPVIFTWPSSTWTNLPTSVDNQPWLELTPVVDDKVNVPVWPAFVCDAVIVVVSILWSINGPFVNSTLVSVQDVWPVLANFFTGWLGWHKYITSALCAYLISNNSDSK